MSRLDLKCIEELLPNILDKSNEEDIERLEQLILKYKYKNYERPWLSYFAKQPDYEHLKEDSEESLERWPNLINILVEENRIKDPSTLSKGDKFHLVYTKIIVDSHYYRYLHGPFDQNEDKLTFNSIEEINEYRFKLSYKYIEDDISLYVNINSLDEYDELNTGEFSPFGIFNGRFYLFKNI